MTDKEPIITDKEPIINESIDSQNETDSSPEGNGTSKLPFRINFHIVLIIAILIILLQRWKPCKKIHPFFWFVFGAAIGCIFRL